MNYDVVEFLKNEVESLCDDYKVFENLYGEIQIDDLKAKKGKNTIIHLSTGSVYGIFAIETDDSNEKELFSECNKIASSVTKDKKIYPVYWGKDISPGSRIADHVRPRESTGNAELENINALRGFKLVYGCIYVSKYNEFEKHLHQKYPPLVGTPRRGSKSKFTIIDN